MIVVPAGTFLSPLPGGEGGGAAVVAGNTFTAQVPLIEGTNVITAVATTPSGATGTGAVQVFRDSTAPRMAVAFPAEGATVHDPSVPVGGTVQDNTNIDAGPLHVTVNGIAAGPDGTIYVTNISSNDVAVIKPGADTVAYRIYVPGGPTEAAVGPDGERRGRWWLMAGDTDLR